MMTDDKHQEKFTPKTFPCRNCSEPIELDGGGCYIWVDVNGVESCHGYTLLDWAADVQLEYDSLCPKCFYDKSIEREPGLCDVLFEGAEAGPKVSSFLDKNDEVRSWKRDPDDHLVRRHKGQTTITTGEVNIKRENLDEGVDYDYARGTTYD